MKYFNPETKQEIEITEHIMTRNFWEYYIIEKLDEDTAFGLVHGHQTEMGYVSLKELKPYIISRETNLTELMPPVGWQVKEEES